MNFLHTWYVEARSYAANKYFKFHLNLFFFFIQIIYRVNNANMAISAHDRKSNSPSVNMKISIRSKNHFHKLISL